ncbi:hypothetical protein D4764_22G0005740 [Takifugu flavidus]|uniref:Uncharacterized protein n=1 Tax=Takifugu flavidus TaxID=433684 RepID=A0A5C6NH80_9TELE|nr:hypothetical protein D4764_22G0005740 [Takifugu flavidus]
MQKQVAFFPGKLQVVFLKGPLGFLLQEPSDEAKRGGGGPSDKMEVQGDYVLQFGKYKGKSFRWLLQNDVGYTVYLIKNVQSEEAAGLCMADSHSKDSLQSYVSYALSFQEIQALLTYDGGRGDGVTASSEDDQLAGFGARAKSTWKEIWDSGGDGYADFVIGKRCVPGTRMSRLQQNLLKRQQSTTSSTPAEHPMKAPAEPLAMEEDVEMEREMLSIHNSDLQVQSYAMPVAAAALPTPLMLDSIEKIVQGILEMQQQQQTKLPHKLQLFSRQRVHTAPDPSCSSCGWWVHWRREYPHSWFGHQALPIEPQAWLQGGALVNLRAGVLRGLAPSYLEELVIPYQPNRPLRSQNAGLLVVPRVSRSRMGGRAFSYQAPLLWNQLPVQVREADSIATFKIRLKTFLFEKAYCF